MRVSRSCRGGLNSDQVTRLLPEFTSLLPGALRCHEHTVNNKSPLAKLSLLIGMPFVFSLPIMARTTAAETGCGNSNTAVFDGTTPLHYFKAAGDSGSKLDFYLQNPPACLTRPRGNCKPSTYISSGDIVAVGKTCDAWAFVQHIGEKNVNMGWVKAAQLVALTTTPQAPLVEERGRLVRQFTFNLTKGSGLPVCEAYLQRLNITEYRNPPFCGRPENGEVPGFTILNRVSLNAKDVSALFPNIFNFWFPPRAAEGDSILALRSGSDDISSEVGRTIDVWRYEPPVDIDNDLKPDNIIVWSGYGVTEAASPCGFLSPRYGRYRQRQLPIILNTDNKTVDADRTEAFLKSPVPLTALAMKFKSATGAKSRFKAIGRSVGIFKYRGLYYLDAFSEPSANYAGERLKNPQSSNILSVLLRRNGRTAQVCEYSLGGDDYSMLDDGE